MCCHLRDSGRSVSSPPPSPPERPPSAPSLFLRPAMTRPRHPGKCRAAEHTGLMRGMRLPAHLLDLRNVTSCVTLQLLTAPPRPSHVRVMAPRLAPVCAPPGTILGLGLLEEELGRWEEARRYLARQSPELWFFLAGKASKPTGWN